MSKRAECKSRPRDDLGVESSCVALTAALTSVGAHRRSSSSLRLVVVVAFAPRRRGRSSPFDARAKTEDAAARRVRSRCCFVSSSRVVASVGSSRRNGASRHVASRRLSFHPSARSSSRRPASSPASAARRHCSSSPPLVAQTTLVHENSHHHQPKARARPTGARETTRCCEKRCATRCVGANEPADPTSARNRSCAGRPTASRRRRRRPLDARAQKRFGVLEPRRRVVASSHQDATSRWARKWRRERTIISDNSIAGHGQRHDHGPQFDYTIV